MKWLPGRHRRRRRNAKRNKWWRYARYSFRLGVLLIVLDSFYLIHIWPDWGSLGHGEIKKTAFIKHYEQQQKQHPTLPVLRWKPVPNNWIPKHVIQAVIVAEDARFYQHQGFDVEAFREAMSYNFEHLNFKYGASTLSQQTVKNMFLSASRNPLRKWHELVLTIGMELKISKQRILEIYLNTAEFGKGIFGVEAAARYYFGVSVHTLNSWQAAELAASLPSPKKHNPHSRSKRFIKHAKKIYRYMQLINRTAP